MNEPKFQRTVSLTREDLKQLAGIFISLGVNLGSGSAEEQDVRDAANTVLNELFGEV